MSNYKGSYQHQKNISKINICDHCEKPIRTNTSWAIVKGDDICMTCFNKIYNDGIDPKTLDPKTYTTEAI